MDSPAPETVMLAYWDTESGEYAYWDPVFDEDRHLPGRRGHDYPNMMVFALAEERDELKENQFNLGNELEQVQGQLGQVQEELTKARKMVAKLKRQARQRQKRMSVGKRLMREAWDVLDSEDEVAEPAPRSVGSVAKRSRGEPVPLLEAAAGGSPIPERVIEMIPVPGRDPTRGPA